MQDLNEPLRDSSHEKDLQERVPGDLQTLNTGGTWMGRKPTVDPSLKKVPWCLRLRGWKPNSAVSYLLVFS